MGKFTQSWLSWNAVLFPEKKHLVCALRTCTVVFFSLFFFFFHFPFILGAAFSFNLCNMDMIQWLKMKSRSAWAAFLTLPSIPPPIYAVLPWLEQDSPAPEWCLQHSCIPGVEMVTYLMHGSTSSPGWFGGRALWEVLHFFYQGYFLALWELGKSTEISYSGRFENCN